jgi:hypothetical protein
MGNARSGPRYEPGEERNGSGVDLSESALTFKTNIEKLEKKWVAENKDGAGTTFDSSGAAIPAQSAASQSGSTGSFRPTLPTSPKDVTVEQLKALKSFLQKSGKAEKAKALCDEKLLVTLESLIELSRYRWTEVQLLALSIVKTMIADLEDVKAMERVGAMAAPMCVHLLGEPESEIAIHEQTKTAAMSVLMNLSRVVIEAGSAWLSDKETRENMEDIRRVATDRCIQNYITREGIIGLMAANTAAYLIGTDDDKRYQELISDAGIPQKLCSALKDTLHGKDVDGAPWKESELVLALLQISFTEENKLKLEQAGAIESLLMIVEGQKTLRGGDYFEDFKFDSTVLCYALRTLVELSFCGQALDKMRHLEFADQLRNTNVQLQEGLSNQEFRAQMQSSGKSKDGKPVKKKRLITWEGNVIANTSNSGIVELSNILLTILEPTPVIRMDLKNTSAGSMKPHIIATYSSKDRRYAESVCDQLDDPIGLRIIKAAKFGEFKSQGRFDKIQGCFESAVAAICFVSIHYKASYRCRMQAELLEKLQQEGRVNCVFVEMTDSGPVKGWLKQLVDRTEACGAAHLHLSGGEQAEAQRSEIVEAVRHAANEKPGTAAQPSSQGGQAQGQRQSDAKGDGSTHEAAEETKKEPSGKETKDGAGTGAGDPRGGASDAGAVSPKPDDEESLIAAFDASELGSADADFADFSFEGSGQKQKMMTGWMEKKGAAVKSWKKRFFVWRPGQSRVDYHTSSSQAPQTLLKSFEVGNVFDVPDRKGMRACRIDLFDEGMTKVLSLAAFSPADKQMWLDEFKKNIEAPSLQIHPRYDQEFREAAPRPSTTVHEYSAGKIKQKGNKAKGGTK